ncbi:MAG: hypothetical protein FWB97_00995 [Oscillospiraceae bacterium]|nr:hypothetical protein [Oscillospiraceae bacterium]
MRILNENLAAANHRLSSANNSTNNDINVDAGNVEELRLENNYNSMADFVFSGELRSNRQGLSDVSRYIQEGISYIQSTQNTLQATQNALQSMRETAVQSSLGTLTEAEREILELDYTQKKFEVDNLGRLSFYGVDFSNPEPVDFSIQQESAEFAAEFPVAVIASEDLGSVATDAAARGAIVAIDSALAEVSASQSQLSDAQDRLMGMATAGSDRSSESSQAQAEVRRLRNEDAVNSANAIARAMLSAPSSSVSAQAHTTPQIAMTLLS